MFFELKLLYTTYFLLPTQSQDAFVKMVNDFCNLNAFTRGKKKKQRKERQINWNLECQKNW